MKIRKSIFSETTQMALGKQYAEKMEESLRTIGDIMKRAKMKRDKKRDRLLFPVTEGYLKRQRRAAHRTRTYGLTAVDVATMEKRQRKACAVFRAKVDLVVDHCHKSGKVRSLLCFHCNSGLGFFRDNPAMLREAANYLEQHGVEKEITEEEEILGVE